MLLEEVFCNPSIISELFTDVAMDNEDVATVVNSNIVVGGAVIVCMNVREKLGAVVVVAVVSELIIVRDGKPADMPVAADRVGAGPQMLVSQ